jgi:hypothetical protein
MKGKRLSGVPLHNYWVVSPNVRNNERTVGAWREASVREQAAFMGYEPDERITKQIGPKFAGMTEPGITPGDRILIARRHHRKPEIVGFGIVRGQFKKRLKGFKPPQTFGSLRRLLPFKAWSGEPSGIRLRDVLAHTTALVQLHPERNSAHKRVCEWMDKQLNAHTRQRGENDNEARRGGGKPAVITELQKNLRFEYKIQTEREVRKARKLEAELVEDFRKWVETQDRRLSVAVYGKLRCDVYERTRNNLIEAKCSVKREHIRMAVGQLLDYAFQGKKTFGDPNKAILLPNKPHSDVEHWLGTLEIRIIWRASGKFFDNANGQFT